MVLYSDAVKSFLEVALFQVRNMFFKKIITLPETNIAPKNGGFQ